MQSIKVQRSGISAEQAADTLRAGLGAGYEVKVEGETLHISKGLARAKMTLRAESGGTVFEVTGEGASILPLFALFSKMMNERGIARKAVAVIDGTEAFRDGG